MKINRDQFSMQRSENNEGYENNGYIHTFGFHY